MCSTERTRSTRRQSAVFHVAVRPHLEEFLAHVSGWYEVCIFTAGQRGYADAVINRIDPKGYISRRYYRKVRQNTVYFASLLTSPSVLITSILDFVMPIMFRTLFRCFFFMMLDV